MFMILRVLVCLFLNGIICLFSTDLTLLGLFCLPQTPLTSHGKDLLCMVMVCLSMGSMAG